MAFYRITLQHDFKGRSLFNVFCLEDETNLLTQETVGQAVAVRWLPLFDNMQYSQMIVRFIEVRRILVANPLAPTLIQPNRFCVGSLSNALGAVCFKMLFRTDLAGKKHRGRYYIPGIAQGLIDLGNEQIGQAAITRMTAARNGMLDFFVDGPNFTGLRLCVAHKDPTETPTRVSKILFSLDVHNLRSRQLGIGI